MKTFSLNDTVYFKLTESGRKILQESATAFHRANPQVDIRYAPEPYKGDWYRNQLHWILSEFGGRSLVGTILPVTDLTFDDPAPDA